MMERLHTFDIGVGCEYTIVKRVGCGNTMVNEK